MPCRPRAGSLESWSRVRWRTITQPYRHRDGGSNLPDHENLYRVPGPAQDWRSAAPEKVTDFTLTFTSFIENPQLSRDGTQLAYSRGRIASDIWLMTMGK